MTEKAKRFIPRNLGKLGYIASTFGIIVDLTGPFLIYYYDIIGCLFWLIVRLGILYLDYKTSNALEYNISIMAKNGFDGWKILKKNIFKILVLENFAVYFLQKYFITEVNFQITGWLIFNIIVGLAIAEVFFTIAHKVMHRYFPEMHKLHHCCLQSSYTTGLFFSELDFFIELYCPILMMVIYQLFIAKDQLGYLVTSGLINAWYALDHDEYFKLPHWNHHKYIN